MKRKHVVLAVVCLANFLACFAQYQTSVMSIQLIEKFNMSSNQFAALTTAQMVPTIFLSLFLGMFIDKIGIRKGVIVALTISVTSLLLKINANSYAVLFVLCMLAGIFGCCFNTINAKIVNLYFETKETSIAMGIIQASLSLGQLLSLALCGNFAYKTVFIASFIIGVVCFILWLIFVKPEEEIKQTNKIDILAVFKYKDAIIIGATLFCLFGSFGAISSFLPSKLLANNYSVKQAGLVTSLVAGARLVGALTFPTILDKRKNKKVLQYSILLVYGCAILALGFVSNYLIVSLLVLIAGYIVGGFAPILFGKPLTLKGLSQDKVASVCGVVSTLQILGAVIVPSYICSPISGNNYTTLYCIGAAVGFMTLVLFVLLNKKEI